MSHISLDNPESVRFQKSEFFVFFSWIHHIFSFCQDLKLMLCESNLKYSFHWTFDAFEWIWEFLTPHCSNTQSIRWPMLIFWSFFMNGSRLTLHRTNKWTWDRSGNLSRILMHQVKILRADLNSGILSYEQKCHAFLWICRTFEGLTLAPLAPRITL